jgi:hypothetical protein
MPATTHTFARPASQALVVAWSLIATMLLVACAKDRATSPPTSNSPAAGVEVMVWIIDDALPPPRQPEPTKSNPRPKPIPTTLTLAEALSPFNECPSPLAEPARGAWTRSGMRILALPQFQVTDFERSLRIAGPVQRQFFAPTTRWSQVFRGPLAEGIHPIQIDSDAVDISSGAFRLLMRCYPTPSATKPGDIALHIDLVPQHIDRRRGLAFDAGDRTPDPLAPPPPAPTIAQEGAVLEPLLMELALSRDELLVLVPEPSVAAPDPAASPRPFGPALPATPTLAEALLSDALVGGDCRKRAILLFRPILPDEYTLTP